MIAFVPSKIRDNPALDPLEYEQKLRHLPPVTRERLMNGDWSISAQGLIRPEWLRRFTMQGQIIRLHDGQGELIKDAHFDERGCTRFATIDTAGTEADKAKENKGKPASWSVMAVWEKPPSKFGRKLLLRHVWRARVGFTDLVDAIVRTHNTWKPSTTLIENKHFGPAIENLLRGKMAIRAVDPGQKDKVERSAGFLNMLAAGEVFIPHHSVEGTGLWVPTLETEWLSWQGQPDETADQIDVASYAAMEVSQGGMQTIVVDHPFWKR